MILLTGGDAGGRITNDDFERLRQETAHGTPETDAAITYWPRNTAPEPDHAVSAINDDAHQHDGVAPSHGHRRRPDAVPALEQQATEQLDHMAGTPATAIPPDFYRAKGLPQLYGSVCGRQDRAVIAIEYTHSLISGKDWRGGANGKFPAASMVNR